MTESIIQKTLATGQTALSEADAKAVLAPLGIPFPDERRVSTKEEALAAAQAIGFPVVLKGAGATLLHKTEQGVVFIDLRSDAEVSNAYDAIMKNGGDAVEEVLVQQMVVGQREFVIGLSRDPQFGPAVMFGLGGIFTEVFKDVCFRIVPLSMDDALSMMQEIKASALLGNIRGLQAVDTDAMAKIILAISKAGMDMEHIAEIDLNPVKVTAEGLPMVVDALITLR